MSDVKGSSSGAGCRFAVVVSRFNKEITEGLLDGARRALADADVSPGNITVVHVPGAFEIPVTAAKLAASGLYDAIITLGCLIKGETMHFEYIADAVAHGIMQVSAATGVPVVFGVLTTLTDQQAEERAAPGPGNKGREAALAAIEMATLFRQLGART